MPPPAAQHSPLPPACGGTTVPGTCPHSFMSAFMLTARHRLRVGLPPRALEELTLDVVLSDETFNRPAQHLRHGHRLDEIAAGFCEGLAFCGIGGSGRHRIGPGTFRWRQHDPDACTARGEIVAI